MKLNDIKLHNEEVQEILSAPPHSLVRWGSSVIGIIILIVFIGSFYFKYPDTIQAYVTITTENPPTWIVARSTGKIKELYVRDHSKVNRGDVLAVIDNASKTKDVINLKSELEKFKISDTVMIFPFIDKVNLGIIQNSYSSFRKSLEEYNNFIKLNLYGQKIKAIEKQLFEYNKYINLLQEQAELSKRSVYLAQNEFKREEELYKKKLTTLSAYEAAEEVCLSFKQSAQQLFASIANTQITVATLKSDLVELELQKQQEYGNLKVNLQSSFEALMLSIKEWEQTFLLISPISGILSFNEIWKENQNINDGDRIFSVVNGQVGRIIGRIEFPVEGSGKVKIGQRVNIQLEGYPYLEYGFLTGRLSEVSLLSNEKKYTGVIDVPQDLVTSYNKKIAFKGELLGNAEIVTDNQSLGARLVSPFKYIYKKHLGR